jgi:hypothetical protein
MPSSTPLPGQSLMDVFPDIGAQAHGWDPMKVTPNSHKKLEWTGTCGHQWISTPNDRVGKGSGCPYCCKISARVLAGFNDLATTHPELARQAHNWDPTTVTAGSTIKREWACALGHIWKNSPNSRTANNPISGCGVCRGNQFATPGFNDLLTFHPTLSEEAHGWDPSEFRATSHKKQEWKCRECSQVWKATIANRVVGKTGCPNCAWNGGFRSTKNGYLYLMKQDDWGLMQIGVSNSKTRRTHQHSRSDWGLLDMLGPLAGTEVFDTEQKIKRYLRSNFPYGLAPGNEKFSGYTESWRIEDLRVESIEELQELAGVS